MQNTDEVRLALLGPYVTTTSLSLPDDMSRDKWEDAGCVLKQIESGMQWWIGDWWAFGERKWGTGQQICEALGFSYATVTTYASISRSYESLSRLKDLTHKHHQIAAPLDEPQRSEILAWADNTKASTRELKTAIRALLAEPTPPPPENTYSTLVIDPPWQIEKIAREVRPNQVEMDYQMLSVDDIVALNCGEWAHDDAHLYLWTTHKYLPDAFAIALAWGFRYQCLMTWVKKVGITPFSWMYSTEHVLFCKRGSLDLLANGKRLDFSAKVSGHSRKPEAFYDLVREVSPGPRLDIFSRQTYEGFDTWGIEEGKFDENV